MKTHQKWIKDIVEKFQDTKLVFKKGYWGQHSVYREFSWKITIFVDSKISKIDSNKIQNFLEFKS